jgi:hypothetical protein
MMVAISLVACVCGLGILVSALAVISLALQGQAAACGGRGRYGSSWWWAMELLLLGPRGQGRSVVIRIGGREERMPSCGECEHSRSALELKNAHSMSEFLSAVVPSFVSELTISNPVCQRGRSSSRDLHASILGLSSAIKDRDAAVCAARAGSERRDQDWRTRGEDAELWGAAACGGRGRYGSSWWWAMELLLLGGLSGLGGSMVRVARAISLYETTHISSSGCALDGSGACTTSERVLEKYVDWKTPPRRESICSSGRNHDE